MTTDTYDSLFPFPAPEQVPAGWAEEARCEPATPCTRTPPANTQTLRPPVTRLQRPEIVVSGRPMRDITADALQALVDANRPPWVFCWGRTLSRVVPDGHGGAVVEPLTHEALRGILDRCADFVAVDNRTVTPARPPKDVVADLRSLPLWPGIPALAGVTTAPTVAADGTLDTTPGYQRATQLFYYGPDLSLGDTSPTDARVAWARAQLLDELLGDFPFVDDASRAHALALLLLPFVRPLIAGPTPLHAIDAPTPGTGKGLLATVLTLPFVPTGVPAMAPANSDDEWRKRLTAMLLSGPSHLLIDNVRQRLQSGDLAAALTARFWTDRMLGRSETVTLPVRCVWLVNGNNLQLSDEIARRTVWIRLDAHEERPWERQAFRHEDLPAWATQHRGDLVTASLVLVRRWLESGRPEGTTRLGSFEEWSRVMGGILQTAEVPGFLGNTARLYEQADADRQPWLEFTQAWWERHQSHRVGVRDLFQFANEQRLLEEQLGAGDEQSRRIALGNLLRQQVERIYGGLRIEPAGLKQRALQYRLMPVGSESGESGESKTTPSRVEDAGGRAGRY